MYHKQKMKTVFFFFNVNKNKISTKERKRKKTTRQNKKKFSSLKITTTCNVPLNSSTNNSASWNADWHRMLRHIGRETWIRISANFRAIVNEVRRRLNEENKVPHCVTCSIVLYYIILYSAFVLLRNYSKKQKQKTET